MNRVIIILLIIMSCFHSWGQDTYYVATTGSNDTGNGSIGNPWASFNYAVTQMSGGDTLYIRGGIYYPTSQVVITSSLTGTSIARTAFFGYPGEKVILDYINYNQPPNQSGNSYGSAVLYSGSGFLHFRDITARNVKQVDEYTEITAFIAVPGHNTIFENMVAHDIGGRGFFQETPWGWGNEPLYDTTYYINCDAYNCADSLAYTPGAEERRGNQADGFKTYGNTGSVYYYTGCRAWNVSDDGYDLGNATIIHIDNCFSFLNGHSLDGDGNGFKLGSHGDTLIYLANPVTRYVSRTVTAYNRIPGFFFLEYEDYYRHNGRMWNCISYEDRNAGITISSNGLPGRENVLWQIYNTIIYSDVFDPDDYYLGGAAVSATQMNYTESNNTWVDTDGWPGWQWSTDVTFDPATDWVSGGDSATIINQLSAPRQADGSLPVITAFNLVAGSDLIDAGLSNIPDFGVVDYIGNAVDIGAFEFQGIDSTATDITAFSLLLQTAPATINTTDHTINIQVYYGADITAQAPTIAVSSGANIVPPSGTTIDFTLPVPFMVTALDGETEQAWLVTVTVASAPPTSGPGLRQGKQLNLGRAIKFGTKYLIIGTYEETPPPVTQIIADHTVVALYNDIPQRWIDSVKTMLVTIAGMSHSHGYYTGALLLEQLDPTYQVTVSIDVEPVPEPGTDALTLARPWMTGETIWTSPSGIAAAKTSQIVYDTNNPYDVYIFGWSYQATWDSIPGGTIDPVYTVRWAGRTEGGLDGSNRWGLDSGDSILTNNRVSMDTYLNAFAEFREYCDENLPTTNIIYSTLIVDGHEGTESAFQRELKSQHIRNYVENNPTTILFDFGDILSHSNSGSAHTVNWDDGAELRPHNQIHPENLMDYDESWNIIDPKGLSPEDHIGEVGALRLGKALWWMLARIAGWDGEPE